MGTKLANGGKAFFVPLFALLFAVLVPVGALAATQSSSRSVNVTAIVPGPPPSTPAVITSPPNNTTVTVGPIVISGTCQPTLLVRVFNNDVLTGTTTCANDGTFSINTTLTNTHNVLSALNYDTLDQAGPDSPKVNVYFPSFDSPASGLSPSGDKRAGNKPSSSQPISPDNPASPNNPSKEPGTEGTLASSTVAATLLSFWLLSVVLIICLLLLKRRKKRNAKE